MSKNESRVERKKESKNLQEKSKLSLNKMYYWIIGFLFLVLFVLVLFIFSRSGDNVNVTDDQDQTEIVDEEIEQSNSTNGAEQSESDAEVVEEPAEDEENTESEEELETEEETVVNEDAPIDESYAVNYNSGSADRVAIKEEIMQATGLGNDLIEYWVGNNGPGRVTATVANPDQSRIYEVQLQYGEGEWYVTSYQPLDTLPENFD